MSLRNRLLVSILATLLLSLVAGGAFTYWHAVAKIETEMQAAVAVGSRIARNAVDDWEEATDPFRRLALLVADFEGDRHLRATLVSPDGKVLLASKVARADDQAPGWFVNLLAAPPKKVEMDLPEVFDKYGTVVLQSDPRNEVAEVWGDVWLTLTVLTIFCALVLAFIYWTLASTVRPLQNLTTAFARVGDGDYRERVQENGPSELVSLYQGFNQMVERLARSEAQNKRLQEQLTTVQDEERADLARDLHDEIGPLLFAADVDAVAIEQLVKAGEYEAVTHRVGIIREAIGRMQRHVRDILGRLRSAMLLDVGLAHAIDNLVAFWRVHRANLNFKVHVPEESFGELIDGTIYRIVQESLSNAVRHGTPSLISIEVKQNADASIDIRVIDDGCGLKPGRRSGGLGIVGMQERVGTLGGSLEVANRTDGAGVIVAAHLPARGTHPSKRGYETHEATLQ
ncbi:MAG: HAMP domain-containing protein [Hyphomicrobium sp.]|nr:HAMP domain-containing protein [Hyphomicrobium sp.]